MKTKLLTKKDVAAALSMSTRSVDRLVASGVLKPIRILRSVRFNPADIFRIIQGVPK